jgi:hypothetical protein
VGSRKEAAVRNQGQLIVAIGIILVGVILLVANVLDINLWMVCWPSLFIALGLLLLLRPQLIGSDPSASQRLLGDIRRRGPWDVSDSEFLLGIGDVSLDLTETEIPLGETIFRVWGFVTDANLVVPEGIGVAVSTQAFVSGAKFFGMKRDAILMPLHIATDDYEAAERRIAIETRFFVGEVKVDRGKP